MGMDNREWLEKMVRGYLKCALWSSTDQNGEPLDARFRLENISASSTLTAYDDCLEFVRDCAMADLWDGDELDRGLCLMPDTFGHDFWLSRNGHGAGFFDRHELYGKAKGDKLQSIARKFGEVNPFDDGNGWVVFE